MQSTFAFGDRFRGQGGMFVFANVCVLFKPSECVLINYCTYVLFLFILFTFSGEAAGRSLQCVFARLTDLFLRRPLLLNITHLDAQRVPLPLIPCLLTPYYHANNIQQITQHFHLDEASSEGPYSTCRIRDDFIYRAVSLIPQELKSRGRGKTDEGEEGFYK